MSLSAAGFFFIWAVVVLAYFTPTIVVLFRSAPSPGSVIVVNVLLGWTVIGWIVALAMSVRSRPQAVRIVQLPPSSPPAGSRDRVG